MGCRQAEQHSGQADTDIQRPEIGCCRHTGAGRRCTLDGQRLEGWTQCAESDAKDGSRQQQSGQAGNLAEQDEPQAK